MITRDDLWLRQVTSFDTVDLMAYGQLWMSIGKNVRVTQNHHMLQYNVPNARYITLKKTSLEDQFPEWRHTLIVYNTIISLQFYNILSTILLLKYFKRYSRLTRSLSSMLSRFFQQNRTKVSINANDSRRDIPFDSRKSFSRVVTTWNIPISLTPGRRGVPLFRVSTLWCVLLFYQ